LLANFSNEWAIYAADGLPFLADSYDESMKLYRAQRPLMEKKLADQGMVLLYSVAWPPQGIYSKKPINSVADLKGSKWRAYSPTTARIGELVGAQPVTVQAAELAQALATGVVEANMTSGATGVDSKLFEHLKYYYDVQAWLPKNAVIVNKRAFDALDKPTQEAVVKAAAAAEARGWAESRKVNEDTLATLKKNGMEVLPPSAQLKADMKRVGDTILKEWLDRAGAEGKALLDAYRR
jgi:TRAP-type C4-dicarboxylate transport system substrate-binding protein